MVTPCPLAACPSCALLTLYRSTNGRPPGSHLAIGPRPPGPIGDSRCTPAAPSSHGSSSPTETPVRPSPAPPPAGGSAGSGISDPDGRQRQGCGTGNTPPRAEPGRAG